MSTLKKILLASAIFIFVAGILGVIFLLNAVFGDAVRRRESMSRTEATNMIDFPLVDSATNIFDYFHMTGLNHSEEYIRLTVAKRDLTNQINLATANSRDQMSGRPFQYEKTNIDFSEITSGPSLGWWDKPLSWWSPGKITNGFYVRNKDSGFYLGAYKIWIDQNSGTIFFYQSL